jgi:hypothetical protein
MLTAFLAISLTLPDTGPTPADAGPDLLDRLRALPGAIVKEIEAPASFDRAFEIWLLQPADHDDPDRGKFRQRMFLAHRDPAGVMVLETEGYAATWIKRKELARLLGANQLMVEHRYWGVSKPEPLDWNYLTVEQSAKDLHRIVGLLRPLYSGSWVSTGRSKGGMTALFHRAFFPDDVAATVAVAAPIMTSRQDPCFVSFMKGLGDLDCRRRIDRFQRQLLLARDELLPLVREHVGEHQLEFLVALDILYEYAVVQYPYSFWQGAKQDCSEIPGPDASATDLFGHLDSVVSLRSYDIGTMARDRALVHQAVTEIGYHGFRTEHLDGLLKALPDPDYGIFAPLGPETTFDPSAMKRVLRYLEHESEHVLLLYGENDPWTACAAPLASNASNLKLVVPGRSHEFRIGELPEEMKREVDSALRDWLGIANAPVRPARWNRSVFGP